MVAIVAAALSAVPAAANPTDEVRAAILRLEHLSSYRMTAMGHGRSYPMDVDRNGNVRVFYGQVEIVCVGPTRFVRTPGSNWRRLADTPEKVVSTVNFVVSRLLTAQQQALGLQGFSAADLGTRTIDRESLRVYRRTIGTTYSDLLYVGLDGVVRRITGPGETETDVLAFSSFNAISAIRAPLDEPVH